MEKTAGTLIHCYDLAPFVKMYILQFWLLKHFNFYSLEGVDLSWKAELLPTVKVSQAICFCCSKSGGFIYLKKLLYRIMNNLMQSFMG